MNRRTLCALAVIVVAALAVAGCDPYGKSKAQTAGDTAALGKAAVALVALGYSVDTVNVNPGYAGYVRKLCENNSPSCVYAYDAWTTEDGNLLAQLDSGQTRCTVPQGHQDFAAADEATKTLILGAPAFYSVRTPEEQATLLYMGAHWSCFQMPVID